MSTLIAAPSASTTPISRKQKRLLLLLAGAMLAAILLVSFFAPAAEDDDRSPSSYNSGSAGVKAAFLVLTELGYKTERWEGSASDLRGVDAPHTTLVLASPVVPPEDQADIANAIEDFLNRGGRVIATGVEGAYLIPGGETAEPTEFYKGLCISTPEGQGTLALAGPVSMEDPVRWKSDTVATRVQQRCGGDAVAVTVKVGQGEAVWWSTPLPMSNRGLKEDASLKLLLASVGERGRRVLFDESLHGDSGSVWDQARGLPVRSLLLQSGVVALLLVLSFGRRSGPVRSLTQVVRSSPLEFAESMGHLYNKAGATQVAASGARRRLLRYLHEHCGLSHDALRRTPAEIAEALQQKLGGNWDTVEEHLTQSMDGGEKALSSKSVLELVKAMDRDIEALGKHLKSHEENRR